MQIRLAALGLALIATPFAAQTAFADTGSQTPPSATKAKAPPSSEAVAVAREIIAAGIAEKDRPVIFEGMEGLIDQQLLVRISYDLAEKDAGLKAIYDRHRSALRSQIRAQIERRVPAMYEALAVSYAQEFTLPELRDIRSFMITPAGRGFLTRTNSAMASQAIMDIGQAVLDEGTKAADTTVTALQTELEAYIEKHPDLEARLYADEKATPAETK